MCHQLVRYFFRKREVQPLRHINGSKFTFFTFKIRFNLSGLLRNRGAFGICLRVYRNIPPVAVDIAPAVKPAIPVNMMFPWAACAEAAPGTRLAVEMMPSFAPITAARSQPIFSMMCCSLWRLFIVADHSIEILAFNFSITGSHPDSTGAGEMTPARVTRIIKRMIVITISCYNAF